MNGHDPKHTFHCSFCGKSQREVYRLFAVATSMICDECVDLCAQLLSEARAEEKQDIKEPSDG